MKFLTGCVCSAVLGSFFTIWMLDGQQANRGSAVAQELPGQAGSVSPLQVPRPVATSVEKYFNADGLSPEEYKAFVTAATAENQAMSIE